MVNILSSALSGATMVTDPMHTKHPGTMGIGHFFMAMDPAMFRDEEDFRTDVISFCDTLRATPAIDPGHPVMVAGDPERQRAAIRLQSGIPIAPGLLTQLRQVAAASGAAWVL
jgi:LDH2 family malate/lactate/ureidoglycolate dehydrogenase